MLPVSAWPPGPPGASLSPFGRPRKITLSRHRHGFVIPKGAWIVATGPNRVVMFQPRRDPWTNVNRTPGTGLLPGQPPPPPHPPGPPGPPPTPPSTQPRFWEATGQVVYGTNDLRGMGPTPVVQLTLTGEPATFPHVPQPTRPGPWSPPQSPTTPPFWPQPQPWMTHDQYLEAWRAWQRAIGRTSPPIRPLPGRRPPNFFGWRPTGARGTTIVQQFSGGTVLADGQNVVIAGGGHATITQAFSV